MLKHINESMSRLHAIDYNGIDPDQYKYQKKEFNRQMIYCVVSIIIFFIAIVTSDPNVMATIPGGGLTLLLIDVGIIVLVIALCMYSKKA
jgi:hypothetical protein